MPPIIYGAGGNIRNNLIWTGMGLGASSKIILYEAGDKAKNNLIWAGDKTRNNLKGWLK